jgi:hypothetical protein
MKRCCYLLLFLPVYLSCSRTEEGDVVPVARDIDRFAGTYRGNDTTGDINIRKPYGGGEPVVEYQNTIRGFNTINVVKVNDSHLYISVRNLLYPDSNIILVKEGQYTYSNWELGSVTFYPDSDSMYIIQNFVPVDYPPQPPIEGPAEDGRYIMKYYEFWGKR